MLEEALRLAEERQQFRQQHVWIFGFEHVDVARADAGEVGHGNLALISAALHEEHLARFEVVGEGCAVGHRSPTADAQVFRLDVFNTDVAFDALGCRVGDASLVELDDIAESDDLANLGLNQSSLPSSLARYVRYSPSCLIQ